MSSAMPPPADGCTQCGDTRGLEWTGDEWLCAECLDMLDDESEV